MASVFDFHPTTLELKELGIKKKAAYLNQRSEDEKYFDLACLFVIKESVAIRYMYHEFTGSYKEILDDLIKRKGLDLTPTKAEKENTKRNLEGLLIRLKRDDSYRIIHMAVGSEVIEFFGYNSPEHYKVYEFEAVRGRRTKENIRENKRRRQGLIAYMPELIERVDEV